MKKRQNKKRIRKAIDTIKNRIYSYFENDSRETYPLIKILDEDSRKKVSGYDNYKAKGYTGVTDKYLRRYLFNNKYSLSFVQMALLELLNEEKVNTLYCSDINHIVWETEDPYHNWLDRSFNPELCIYSQKEYDKLSWDDEEDKLDGIDDDITYQNAYKKIVRNYFALNSFLNKSNK